MSKTKLADLVAVRGEGAEHRLDGRVERRVPVQVAVVVRIDPGDDRRRRRRRPRRRADRLIEADSARGELVDRPRVHVPGAVAAEVVRAQRIGDVDDDVHSAADCSDGLDWRRAEACTSLRALRRGHDLALRQRSRADRDPVVRADGRRAARPSPRSSSSSTSCRSSSPRSSAVSSSTAWDFGRRASSPTSRARGGRRHPAAAHDGWHRDLAAHGTRLLGAMLDAPGRNRARSTLPRRRRARRRFRWSAPRGSAPESSRARSWSAHRSEAFSWPRSERRGRYGSTLRASSSPPRSSWCS